MQAHGRSDLLRATITVSEGQAQGTKGHCGQLYIQKKETLQEVEENMFMLNHVI